MCFTTSSLVNRPPRPVAEIFEASSLFSSTMRRTAGLRSVVGTAVGFGAAAGGGVAGVAAGVLGAADFVRLAGGLFDLGDGFADLYGGALLGDAFEDAGGGGWEIDVGFVGLELAEHFVLGYGVAVIFVPAQEDGFAD